MNLRSLLAVGVAGLSLAAGACQKKPKPAPPTVSAEGLPKGEVAPDVAAPAQPAATPAAPERVDPRNTNTGGGAIVGSYRAGKRTNLLNDMSQLGQFVEIQYQEAGKMPDPAAIKANLTTARNILKEIDDGFIILTGTKNHAGLWAYEVDADKVGGVGLVAGRAQRLQADEVKQMLAQK
jgi:hypothetical protein